MQPAPGCARGRNRLREGLEGECSGAQAEELTYKRKLRGRHERVEKGIYLYTRGRRGLYVNQGGIVWDSTMVEGLF